MKSPNEWLWCHGCYGVFQRKDLLKSKDDLSGTATQVCPFCGDWLGFGVGPYLRLKNSEEILRLLWPEVSDLRKGMCLDPNLSPHPMNEMDVDTLAKGEMKGFDIYELAASDWRRYAEAKKNGYLISRGFHGQLHEIWECWCRVKSVPCIILTKGTKYLEVEAIEIGHDATDAKLLEKFDAIKSSIPLDDLLDDRSLYRDTGFKTYCRHMEKIVSLL